MRIALGRILSFFLVLALLAGAMQFVINKGFRSIQTSDFGVSNRIVNGEINADIVISGSSRALVHYDPRIIESVTGLKTFNIGKNGSQTDMQLAVLKTYLDRNSKPTLIVHNLDLFSFQVSHDIYDVAQYIPYLDQPAIFAGVRRVYPGAWKWKLCPLYGYLVEDLRFTWMKGFKAFFGVQPLEDHYEGFVPRDLHWTGDFERFREQNQEGVRFEIEDAGTREVRELIALCKSRGIPLLFVYSPEHRESQALVINREEIFAMFRDMSDRNDVSLWDFSDSSICENRAYFYNSQHLNAGGADRFSHELARRLARHLGSSAIAGH